MQARYFTKNVPKILDLKSSSEQIFSRKLSLGAPAAMFVFIHSFTSIVAEKSSSKLRFYEK